MVKRFKIKRLKIYFVGKYRYNKNNDLSEKFTTWGFWRFGIFFRINHLVGTKGSRNVKNWDKNTVKEYMFGMDLFIFKWWITISRGALELKID